MTEVEDPTETPRRLRVELVRQRERAGLALVDAAGALDWPVERLHRIEAGFSGASVADVHALLCAYRSGPDVVDTLVGLARVTRQQRWWNDYRQSLTPEYQNSLATRPRPCGSASSIPRSFRGCCRPRITSARSWPASRWRPLPRTDRGIGRGTAAAATGNSAR